MIHSVSFTLNRQGSCGKINIVDPQEWRCAIMYIVFS